MLSASLVNFERYFEPVFQPVSFDLEAGQLLLITGANGCGKTTLIRVLAGILHPTSGAIDMAARNMAYVAPDRCFGVVQVAGGNMHHRVHGGTSLAHVQFIGMNGEFEWCGPDGGVDRYGRQTQWVMLREQFLRRWKDGRIILAKLSAAK